MNDLPRKLGCAVLGLFLMTANPSSADTRLEPQRQRPPLAMVLLSKPVLPAAEQIVRAFGQFEAGGPALKSSAQKPGAADVIELTISTGGRVLIALMRVAVPDGEADSAARFSVSSMGTGWKPAPHTAHLIVTMPELTSAAAEARVSLFTSVLAAVVESTPATGIYWGSAGATHDPKFFAAIARERDRSARMMLWSGVSVARQPDGRPSLLSLGMEHFGLPDLLLVGQKGGDTEALSTLFDFLGYVLSRGKALPEGDTIGRTATERLRVRYVPSPVDPSKRVWTIELK